MTVITKTNERDERKQISDALTSNTADIATNTADIATNVTAIAALDTRITTLEGGVNGTPPTVLYGRPTAAADLQVGINISRGIEKFPEDIADYNVWHEVVGQAATNPGVITFLSVLQTANASDRDAGARLTVDSVVVWATDDNFWQVTGDDSDGASLVGAEIFGDGGFSALPFADSWSLEARKTENAAGTVTIQAFAEWHI